jgi:hypothetical protein
LQVITDQELLSTQLLQKTEEIAQLNAKLKLWESMREKQESECQAHTEDLKNLKLEIKKLKYVRGVRHLLMLCSSVYFTSISMNPTILKFDFVGKSSSNSKILLSIAIAENLADLENSYTLFFLSVTLQNG